MWAVLCWNLLVVQINLEIMWMLGYISWKRGVLDLSFLEAMNNFLAFMEDIKAKKFSSASVGLYS